MKNKYPEFSKRLSALMDEQTRTINDLKIEANVTYEMARRYTLGVAFPRPDKLEIIAKWLNTSVSYLAYGTIPAETSSLVSPPNASRAPFSIEMSDGDDGALEIPYYQVNGSCGAGSENDCPEMKGKIKREPSWFKKYKVKPEHAMAIYAHGDSMQPYLMDGDLVVLDTSKNEPKSGEAYLIAHPDGERIKRLRREIDGTWVLESDNLDKKRYPDERVSPEHADLMRIIGLVIYRQG